MIRFGAIKKTELIGLGPGASFLREGLRRHQLQEIRETLVYATEHSRFYRRLFSGCSDFSIGDFESFAFLPLTTSEDLARDPLAFLCSSQSEVERVVTLRSSGTTGQPKRVFFAREDLEPTVDFFQHGMLTLVQAGQRGGIARRGTRPHGSDGDRSRTCSGPREVIDEILLHRADCLVGIPVQASL